MRASTRRVSGNDKWIWSESSKEPVNWPDAGFFLMVNEPPIRATPNQGNFPKKLSHNVTGS